MHGPDAASAANVIGVTATRFAPVMAAVILGVTLLDVAHSRNIARLRDVRWSVAAMEVCVSSAAYAAVMIAWRSIAVRSALHARLSLLAGAIAVAVLFLLSLFMRPARLEQIALACTLAGAIAAIIVIPLDQR